MGATGIFKFRIRPESGIFDKHESNALTPDLTHDETHEAPFRVRRRRNRPSGPTIRRPTGSRRHLPSAAAIRETIESVVIAFVLAFLFRTFEAEAFVIPTGSMAPTLMGRHKDLVCPKCGYPYQVSASEEVDAGRQPEGRRVPDRGRHLPDVPLHGQWICERRRSTPRTTATASWWASSPTSSPSRSGGT